MKYRHRYLPLSEETRRQGLYVLAGGYALIPAQSPYPPLPHPLDHDLLWHTGRTLQEYQLIYITRGGGEFQSRSLGRRRVLAGDIFMLFPGEWHRYRPDFGSGWDEYWVAFRGDWVQSVLRDYAFTPGSPFLTPGLSQTLLQEFIHLTEEMHTEAVGYAQVVSSRVLLILALAVAQARQQEFSDRNIVLAIERAKCLMLEQSDSAISVKALAAEVGVGYSWFRRIFRRYTGFSPSQYHLQLRLNRSAELLRATALPIEEIARQSGFEAANYFSRLFRKKFGCSPRDFRAASRNSQGGAGTLAGPDELFFY